jgi:pilus assembly protein Flp/PilA
MTNPLLVLVQYVAHRLGTNPHRSSAERDRGATATEYAMLVAFIAVAIAAAVTAFGGQLGDFFAGLGDTLHF